MYFMRLVGFLAVNISHLQGKYLNFEITEPVVGWVIFFLAHLSSFLVRSLLYDIYYTVVLSLHSGTLNGSG